ncbi:unnamed protein product [Gulo gulo]|nr:unnamed protein product [Gulo gulo]
MVCQRVF